MKEQKEKIDRLFVGIVGGIEYYYRPDVKEYEWRVPDIREAIEAEEGCVILAADYAQVEIKIMAFFSGDPSFIEAINNGKDIYSFVASQVYGKRDNFTYELINAARKDESHPRYDELVNTRFECKSLILGILYGAGAENIAEQTGMDPAAAQEFIDDFFNTYPKIKEWIDSQARLAIKYGYSNTIRGRKRFYYVPEPSYREYDRIISQIKRWASNQPIQGTSADILKLAMVSIYERLKLAGFSYDDARILFVVHDEIVMTCRVEIQDIVENIMVTSMSEAYSTIIPGVANKVDVSVDKTWKKA
jgi:DNA polymerase-1